MPQKPWIYSQNFAKIHSCYVAKAERKNRTKKEVNEVICWLTGLSLSELDQKIAEETTLEAFFTDAPALNPKRFAIKGIICGVRIETIEDPLMKEIRYLDKLIDELAKGKSLKKILQEE